MIQAVSTDVSALGSGKQDGKEGSIKRQGEKKQAQIIFDSLL